jgi:uncharacterized protein
MDIKPLICVEDDIIYWPELCTTVALRLLPNGKLKIYAPYGLDDLMNLIFRKNPNARRANWEKRVKEKLNRGLWPKVKVICD